MSYEDGGPAFQTKLDIHPNGDIYTDAHPGMSVRIFLASQVLKSDYLIMSSPESMGQQCLQIADAIIAQDLAEAKAEIEKRKKPLP